MAFERLKTEIDIIFANMQSEPQDSTELALILHEKLAELRAYGMPLPQDLVDLEEALQSELERRREQAARGPQEG
jgi:hypothetical protein